MPNFFVLGAMKAGTTSLHRYLDQHPQVHMASEKEPAFFSNEVIASFRGPDRLSRRHDEKSYQRLFEGAPPGAALGEATPYYLCDPRAAERIRETVPEARLIITLRQPIDRAFSAYMGKRRQGRETLGFEEALAEEQRRVEECWNYGWHYRTLSRYTSDLEMYHGLFPHEQIRVLLFDDFINDPAGAMRSLYRFLGIDESFTPDTTKAHNQGRLTRMPLLAQWLNSPSRLRRRVKRFLPARTARSIWEAASSINSRWNDYEAPTLDPGLRARLTDEFSDEISRLEAFLGRDLSTWRRT